MRRRKDAQTRGQSERMMLGVGLPARDGMVFLFARPVFPRWWTRAMMEGLVLRALWAFVPIALALVLMVGLYGGLETPSLPGNAAGEELDLLPLDPLSTFDVLVGIVPAARPSPPCSSCVADSGHLRAPRSVLHNFAFGQGARVRLVCIVMGVSIVCTVLFIQGGAM